MTVQVNYDDRSVVLGEAVLHLKPVSPLILERLQSSQMGMPQPPVVEVELAGGRKRKEANPNDPAYLEALSRWRTDQGVKLFEYCFFFGIVERPPKEFVDGHRLFFPEATEFEMQYLWIGSLVADEKALTELLSAVIGQTSVTKEGLEEAKARFPGDGEREPDRTLLAG